MIRFTCPTCKSILEAGNQKAGSKINCPKCSQRILIPPPVQNKTILGVSSDQPHDNVNQEEKGHDKRSGITVSCPGCSRDVPLLGPQELNVRIECAKCGTNFIPVSSRSSDAIPSNDSAAFIKTTNSFSPRDSSGNALYFLAGTALIGIGVQLVLFFWIVANRPHIFVTLPDQLIGVIVGIGMVVCGTILLVAARRGR